LVRFNPKPARLDCKQRGRPKSLFEKERLMINEPILERCSAVGPEIMPNRLNRLERAKDIHFLAKDGVLGATKAQKSLRSEILAGDNFPAQSASAYNRPRQ
jgi:hypothetical protein